MGGDRVPIGVLASGRGSNLQAILDAARSPDYPAEVAVVLSDVEGAFALNRAREAGVPACHISPGDRPARLSSAAEEEILGEFSRRGVRLVALAGFMRIIPSSFLSTFPGPVINIHPSLLPSFPGLDAQGQAFRHGLKVSGCTVHYVDQGIDTGPIIMQAAVPLERGDTAESLAANILKEEHRLYPDAIRLVIQERILNVQS